MPSAISTNQQYTRDLAFYKTVSEISKRFVATTNETYDADINQVLSKVGQHFAVDRSYLFRFENNSTILRNSHEWCAPGVEPMIQVLQELPAEVYPQWTQLILKKNIIHVEDVESMPKTFAERELLLQQGIKSIICCPVVSGERVWGFFGFDAVSNHYKWNENEIDGLWTISNIVADLIHRKHQESEQKKIETMMVHSSKLASIGFLAAGVAHEIRNPLGIAKGFLKVAKDDLQKEGALNERRDTLILKIDKALDRVSSIVTGLQEFARPDSEFVEQLDLHTVLKETVEIFADLYKESGINLLFDLAPSQALISGNKGKLQQIIINLVSNAKDAIEAAKRSGEIKFSTKIQNKKILLTISDNGTGIDPKHLNHVFDPFFTTKEPGKGTGLGLAITSALVHAHFGNISVESQPGAGASFTISFPTN